MALLKLWKCTLSVFPLEFPTHHQHQPPAPIQRHTMQFAGVVTMSSVKYHHYSEWQNSQTTPRRKRKVMSWKIAKLPKQVESVFNVDGVSCLKSLTDAVMSLFIHNCYVSFFMDTYPALQAAQNTYPSSSQSWLWISITKGMFSKKSRWPSPNPELPNRNHWKWGTSIHIKNFQVISEAYSRLQTSLASAGLISFLQQLCEACIITPFYRWRNWSL